MGRLIGGLLSNESSFGRLMTRLWIIIAANIMFAVFSIPVVTIGPALAALYYVMLKSLHSDDTLNPITTFWAGFKQNCRQGIAAWLLFLVLAGITAADIAFCRGKGGVLAFFLYGAYGMLILLVILGIYLAPVMAAFEDTLPHLLRNALFFAARRPLKMLLVTALHVVPVAVTYLDERMRPLYGFLWVTCAAGVIAMVTAGLLIRDIEAYLPGEAGQEQGTPSREGAREKSDRQRLRELRSLDR